MNPITDCRLFLFSLVIWQTGANVNIVQTGTKAGESSFQCGTKLVLTCQIDVYLLSMKWQIDSSSTPFAQCIGNACSLDPTVTGLYEVSANMSVGMFNLTINQVTLENNGTSYICAHNGTNVPSLVIVEDYVPTIIESTQGKITIVSGCIDKSTDVQFTWEKVKNVGAGKESTYEPLYDTDSVNITMCIGNTDCDSTGFVKKSKSIMTELGGNDDYHLRAILYYNSSLVISNFTTGTYKIEDGGSHCSIKCDTVCRLLFVMGGFFVINVIVGCLLLYVMWISYPTQKDHSKEDKWITLYTEILLHIVATILWIVIVILFIVALCYHCSCDDSSCYCCEIVLILRCVFLILLGIHVVLWFILLCVLYGQKGKGYDESDKDHKTKLMVRFIFSTVPLVGLFPVCGWLIRICCREKSDTEDTELSSEKPKRELPPAPFKSPTKLITEKTGEPISRSTKKGQKKLDMFVKQNFGSNKIEDQVSTSEITVQPRGINTVGARSQPLDANATGNGKASTKTKSGGKTNKQRDQKSSTLSKSAAVQSTQNNRNEKTSSQKHVTGDENKSKEEGHENKSPKTTNKMSIEAQTGNNRVTKTGSDHKLSNSNENPPGSLKPDNALPTKAKSRKKKDENKPPNNTISLGAKTQNGDKYVSETLSGDTLDSSDNDSLPNSMKSDNTLPERRKSGTEKGEKGPHTNSESVSAKSHNGDKHVSKTRSGDTLDSSDNDSLPNFSKSDNTLPERRKSGTEKGEKGRKSNTESASAKAHNGSETITRTISAIFHDEEDDTTTVSIDSETKM